MCIGYTHASTIHYRDKARSGTRDKAWSGTRTKHSLKPATKHGLELRYYWIRNPGRDEAGPGIQALQGQSRVWNPGTTGTKQGLEPRSGTKVLLDLEPRHYRDKAGSGPRLMNNVST